MMKQEWLAALKVTDFYASPALALLKETEVALMICASAV
jgi:hypothetical protein